MGIPARREDNTGISARQNEAHSHMSDKTCPNLLKVRKMNTNTKITIHHTLLSIAAVALLSAAASAHGAEVNASLSTREAYVGAPVTLRLEIANASSHDEPVLPEIAGVDIQSAGSPSRSTQTTIINGRRTDRTSAVYAWRIIPRREGAFVIPGITIQVDGKTQTTAPLRFVATKSETGDLLLVEVTGQQQKIYVGQPLKLTLNIWIKPYRDAEHQLTVSEADTWRMISDCHELGPVRGSADRTRQQRSAPRRRRAVAQRRHRRRAQLLTATRSMPRFIRNAQGRSMPMTYRSWSITRLGWQNLVIRLIRCFSRTFSNQAFHSGVAARLRFSARR